MEIDFTTAAVDNIPARLERAKTEYPTDWRRIITEWNAEFTQDTAWLTYSANYLLHTAGVRWAIDPFSLFTRVGGGPQPDFQTDLKQLQLLVLTHAHNDHLDLNLAHALKEKPLTWVIPRFMMEGSLKAFGISSKNIIIPEPGHSINLNNLKLTPFEGLHLRGSHGIPAMGYLAEFSDKRWLFPGDTRNYDLELLPGFTSLDGVFAHLWMGKKGALDPIPPFIEDFCKFFAGLHPSQIVVTHLEEYGRDANDFWDVTHYDKVEAKLNAIEPGIKMCSARMGQKVTLGPIDQDNV